MFTYIGWKKDDVIDAVCGLVLINAANPYNYVYLAFEINRTAPDPRLYTYCCIMPDARVSEIVRSNEAFGYKMINEFQLEAIVPKLYPQLIEKIEAGLGVSNMS